MRVLTAFYLLLFTSLQFCYFANGSSQCCDRRFLGQCALYGDCCYNSNNNEQYMKNNQVRKHLKKLPIFNRKLNPTHSFEERYMVSSCDDTDSMYYNDCNYNFADDDIPVIQSIIVYRNLACARCHNVDASLIKVQITNCTNMRQYMGNLAINEISLKNLSYCHFDIIQHVYWPIPKLLIGDADQERKNFFYRGSETGCSNITMILCENTMRIGYDEYGNRWENEYCAQCFN